MHYALSAIALMMGTTAVAQTAYLPPEVHITRTEPSGTCFVGTISVSARDGVAIGMRLCPGSANPARGGMALTGHEEPVVRQCLNQARTARTDREVTYRTCLQAGLGPQGITVN